jgi:hypothetical protein
MLVRLVACEAKKVRLGGEGLSNGVELAELLPGSWPSVPHK